VRASRLPRSAVIVATATATVMAVIVTSRESPVGEAPPLTALTSASAGAPAAAPGPAAIGPEAEPEPEPVPADPDKRFRTREIQLGDAHPLDIVFHPKGTSIYVSADDGTLREYTVKTGDFVHKASVQAQGDHIRLLFDRYIAVLRHEDAARIPVMDTTRWDRDPVLLEVGEAPGDIIELADGKSVVAATTTTNRVARFELPSGARVANITLPHATGQLFLLQAEGRPYVGAMGMLTRGGRAAGAWIDLFDPNETPFGATRRSISVGREPGPGAVTADGGALFFADRVSNTATLLRVAGTTEVKETAVGLAPKAGFVMAGDRYGVTLNSAARTASVIDLATMKVESTLMLNGVPRAGAASRDGSMLFVALGGSEWPPKGSGVVIIAGDPPKVTTSLSTGKGAIAVAVSKDGSKAAVASYYDKSITILEQ
jgi:DNA-binding beta-propeller fold protein YncE